jgi:hypothetical protein
MAFDIYSPTQLYRVMFDERTVAPTSFFLDNFFPNSFLSTQEEILFDKIEGTRKIAPFMLPNEQGKPIYKREGERIQSFKPAYTKPKDSVKPSEMLAMQPGELATRQNLMSPAARYNAEVQRIAEYHRNAIMRLWDYMGAKAILDGQLTINYQTDAGVGKSVTLDFDRASGHTVTKGVGARWGDSGVSIFDDLQSWIDTVANAQFGGSVANVILGSQAATAFMADVNESGGSLNGKLDTNYRGSEEINFNRGIIRSDPISNIAYLGTLGSGIRVWRYTGSFQNNDGSYTQIMDPRDALLVAPGVDGVKAFGAILDQGAGLNPADIFTKMWDQQDPSARFIMSQSAPLMIPANPNCTLKARVLA